MPAESRALGGDGPGPRRAVVLGDLVLDCVITPDEPLRRGTDVAGRVRFRQGGSAATTARWLARRGMETTLVTAVGDDRLGRDLVSWLEAQDVTVRAVRIAGAGTGRLGVLVEPDGERTFVADRGAILHLRAARLRATWLTGAHLLHLPAYSLLSDPLASAAAWAAAAVKRQGGVVSVDLASSGFLDRYGPGLIMERVAALGPAIVLATEIEAAAALGGQDADRLVELAPLVVVKAGPSGAVAYRREGRPVSVRPRRAQVRDSTGAGDAFDAGFLAAWLAWRAAAPRRAAAPQRAVPSEGDVRSWPEAPSASALTSCLRAGHTAARDELRGARPDPTTWLAPAASGG